MQYECRNIYKRFREKTDLSQERAAELLGKSVESIKAYELDKTIPPNEVVLDMSVIYKAPELRYMHLSRNELGMTILHALNQKSLSEAILSLEDELEDLLAVLKRLRKIGKDNVVDACERDEFLRILKEAKDVSQAITDLEYSTKIV